MKRSMPSVLVADGDRALNRLIRCNLEGAGTRVFEAASGLDCIRSLLVYKVSLVLLGLELPDLQELRRYRWSRLTAHVAARDYGGLLMFDPLNIRYATDSTNMQLWNAHNPFRAVMVCAPE